MRPPDPRILLWSIPVVAALGLGLLIGWGGMRVGFALLAITPAAIIAAVLVRKPQNFLDAALVAGFLGAGLSRYLTAPTGLLLDAVLVAGLLVLVLSRSLDRDLARLRSPMLWVIAAWTAMCVLQLLNPEAVSRAAWFYSVRGVALYFVLALPLGLLLIRDRKDARRLLHVWLALSVLGSLWGMKQLWIGLDPFEQAWLREPGNFSTHVLFGRLRVFSFYSDSGQFGAAQGHALVAAVVLAVGPASRRVRLAYLLVALVSMYGLLISGTRGAMAVPFVGFLVFLLASGRIRVLLVGLALIVAVFAMLRFTFVGQDIYEIRRMRSAIVEGSGNASYQVRVTNQRSLADYLSHRPFGGGIGSAGFWGQRFSPGTFLAELALDSWYVRIWAETGIVGLLLHLAMLAMLMAVGWIRLRQVRDQALRQLLLAQYCGIWGILAASYGNQVLGQMPTGIVVILGLATIELGRRLEASESATASARDEALPGRPEDVRQAPHEPLPGRPGDTRQAPPGR